SPTSSAPVYPRHPWCGWQRSPASSRGGSTGGLDGWGKRRQRRWGRGCGDFWERGEMGLRYAVVGEQANGNYSAYVPDLPGCVATGASVKDVERDIRDAIRFISMD